MNEENKSSDPKSGNLIDTWHENHKKKRATMHSNGSSFGWTNMPVGGSSDPDEGSEQSGDAEDE